jgi:hypothetical protein
MNKEIDYKVLYEEAQAKLDKIAHDELKKRLDETLQIKHRMLYGYDQEEQFKRIKENMSFEFISRLDRDEVQNFINEIGYDKLWAIIKDIYQDVIVNDEEERK